MKIKVMTSICFFFLLVACIEQQTEIVPKSKPEETIETFFENFNSENLVALEAFFDSPFVYILGEKRLVFNSFSEVVDYEVLKASGWHYSVINSLELLYEDDETALIHINFSRLREDASVLSTHDSTYLLVADNSSWKAKVAFSAREMILGND